MTGPGETLVRLVHAIDRLDWAGVRATMADELTVDYSSLFGGAPERLAADALVGRWQGLLPGFDATQHLLGPVLEQVAGGRAEVGAHVRAYHRIAAGDRLWRVAGHYVATLAEQGGSWRLTGLTLQTFYQDGELGLPEVAGERAATTPRRPAT